MHNTFDAHLADGRVFRVNSRVMPDGGVVTIAFDLTTDLRREQELEAARREAVAASQAKTEFLASMSHEIRNPLNGVLGFAQLLQRDKREVLSARQAQMVSGIRRGGEHLLRLIDEVLDLARVEAKGIAISAEPVDVSEVLSEVLDTLQPTAEDANIRFHQAGTWKGLPMVAADRGRYLQILLNLGSNAIKYNRRGGTVTFTPKVESGRVCVTLTDTGLGVPQAEQERLFQPFHRAGQETGLIPGTGIGLAISKKLTEMMGGAIGFRSPAGGGSEFWIALPVHLSGPRSARRTTEPLPPPVGPKARPRATVLYVEDNPANIEFMLAAVAALGNIHLLTAPTAEEGLDIAWARRPDLILLDINLPGMSGLTARRILRETAETAHIPVGAISAAASAADRRRGEQAGFEWYLTKPIRVDELDAVFTALLPKLDEGLQPDP